MRRRPRTAVRPSHGTMRAMRAMSELAWADRSRSAPPAVASRVEREPRMPHSELTDTRDHQALRRAIAQRVADAHEPLLPAALAAMVFGSTGDGIADARSDIDMSIVFDELPDEA